MSTQRNLLFQASNRQRADSGEPPFFDADRKGQYHGYFQNEYGEQMVFVYDYSDRNGVLYHSDNSWEEPVPVTDGKARDLVLDDAEQLWLRACWLVATASSGQEKSQGD